MSIVRRKKDKIKKLLEGSEERQANREALSMKHNAYVKRWVRGELGALRRYEQERGRHDEAAALNDRQRKK